MRSLFYVLTALAVIGLAFWAYRENYETQAAQAKAEELQRAISHERQRLRVLNAEWAYLNRPDRLRDLADINFDTLGLLPLQPYQFGKIDQVAFQPEDTSLPILSPVDVSNMEATQ
jgi:hypothetical protein